MGAELLPLFVREPCVHLKEFQKATEGKTHDNGIFPIYLWVFWGFFACFSGFFFFGRGELF